MTPLRVSVLMGGPSSEHEISLKSGQGIAAALTTRGHVAEPIVIPRHVTAADAGGFVRTALLRSHPDVVFIALHGPFGEDGTVQAICEALHLVYTGSGPQASRLGMDKVSSRLQFERAKIPVPRWLLINPAAMEHLQAVLAMVRFPVVVKPTNQGSSIGVSIVSERDAFVKAVEEAGRYDTRVLVESFVPGREVTVGILGRRALPVVEIQSSHQFFDYTAKYTPGHTTYTVPAPLEPALTRRVQACGLRAHRALGCRHFSRVDVILDQQNQPIVLEVNTIPGFTATSLLPKAAACIGMAYDELCEQLVLMAWEDRLAGHAAESAAQLAGGR